jgi:hypothetical protein
MQTCKKCHIEKPLTSYYQFANGKSYTTCKECYYIPRFKEEVTIGWRSHPEEIRNKIVEDYNNHVKVPIIAERYGIKYNTLSYWIRKGYVK